MNKHLLFCFSIIFILSSNTLYGAAKEIEYVGCDTTKKAFMAELSKEFEKKYKISVKLKGGGSTKGIRDVAAQNADMGGACRQKLMVPSEENSLFVPVALDALTVIVHHDNPIESITEQQIQDILKGRITNWSELGGLDQKLHLAIRKGKIQGTSLMVRHQIFHNLEEEFFTTGNLIFESSGPLEKHVATDEKAIAITGYSSAIRTKELKIVAVNGVKPSYQTIKEDEYIYSRPLYLVYNKKVNNPLVRKFINYARSIEGQEIIKAQGTVPLKDRKKDWGLCREAIKGHSKTMPPQSGDDLTKEFLGNQPGHTINLRTIILIKSMRI